MNQHSYEPDRFLYIAIPEEMATNFGDFKLNPEIKLPIEKQGDENWAPTDLSWEMIISAMLKIIAYDHNHKDYAYYRDFVLAAKPSIIGELFSTGIIKAQSQNFPLAIEIFRAIEGLDPDNANAKINLALVYEGLAKEFADKGHLEEASEIKSLARERYIRVLDVEPPIPQAYLNAGFFYLSENDLDRGTTLLETFLKINDDPKKAKEVKAILGKTKEQSENDRLFKEAYDFILLGQEEKGIAKVTTFLETHESVWNGWFLLGWAKRRLNHFNEAKEAFQKALDLGATEEVDLLNELAICEMELKEFSSARKHLETALYIDGENTKIISNLGVLALRMEKREEAKGFFQTVLEFNPEDPLAQKFLEELE
jgi:tetratricopeptide (TPR) repeat protein